MSTKNEAKELRKSKIKEGSKFLEWHYVDADNEFDSLGLTFTISDDVKEYRVHNKYGQVEEYTNESLMDEILVVINSNYIIKFYNQDYELINKDLITLKNQLK